MNQNIAPEEALKRINPLIEKVDKLLEKSYIDGVEERELVDIMVKEFLRASFKDDRDKIKDYNDTHPYTPTLTSKERQRNYIHSLKRRKYYLLAYKEELKLIIDSRDSVRNLEENNISTSPLTQHFHGDVGQLAFGDINNYNTTIYLNALIKAIEESNDIPEKEKDNLIDKIKGIANNPYVSGIGAGLIVEAIKTGLVGK